MTIFVAELEFFYSVSCAMLQVSLQILPKEKIGVAGRTGSGKSTLMLAIYRLYELMEGQIFIDGVVSCDCSNYLQHIWIIALGCQLYWSPHITQGIGYHSTGVCRGI